VEAKGAAPGLAVWAHPAVDALTMTIPSPGILDVSAATSTAGPGYHRRMCDDIHEIGRRLGFSWAPSDGNDILDETGYFETADRGGVDREMLDWIGTGMALIDRQVGEGANQIAISMPVDFRPIRSDLDVLTVLGPRDRAWVREAARDPTHAIGMLPWWGDVRDAVHYRDRALCRMWVDVRWVEPVDEPSRRTLEAVDRDLAHAHELDQEFELPWREWSEIRTLLLSGSPQDRPSMLDRTIAARSATADQSAPLIGYRRGQVRVSIGQRWSVAVPGSFAEASDDDAYIAFDADRTVRLSVLEIRGRDGSVPEADELVEPIPPGDQPILPGDPRLRGHAVTTLDDRGGVAHLQGTLATAGHLAVVTIVAADQEWARETWRSIRFS
jgi:hypothetical protein